MVVLASFVAAATSVAAQPVAVAGEAAVAGTAALESRPQPAPPPSPSLPPWPTFGAMLAAGAPDGATASLIYRPVAFAHAELGGGYNLVSKGIRAGATVVPFGVGPSATVEAGRFFDGDANGIARQLAGSTFGDKAVLQRLGYDFVNAHLGIEFGSRRATFFVHAGMSYIRASVHNLNEQLTADAGTGSSTTVTFHNDPAVRLFTPSAKLGLIFYIW